MVEEEVPNENLVAAELRAERPAGWSCAFGGGGLALVVIGWVFPYVVSRLFHKIRLTLGNPSYFSPVKLHYRLTLQVPLS